MCGKSYTDIIMYRNLFNNEQSDLPEKDTLPYIHSSHAFVSLRRLGKSVKTKATQQGGLFLKSWSLLLSH